MPDREVGVVGVHVIEAEDRPGYQAATRAAAVPAAAGGPAASSSDSREPRTADRPSGEWRSGPYLVVEVGRIIEVVDDESGESSFPAHRLRQLAVEARVPRPAPSGSERAEDIQVVTEVLYIRARTGLRWLSFPGRPARIL